jgi:hypothetical protein
MVLYLPDIVVQISRNKIIANVLEDRHVVQYFGHCSMFRINMDMGISCSMKEGISGNINLKEKDGLTVFVPAMPESLDIRNP